MSRRGPDGVWRIAEVDREKTAALAKALDVPPIVAHLLRERDVRTQAEGQAFLSPSSSRFADPFGLTDMSRAVSRIEKARDRGEGIRVFGDYDVDGISGTAILLGALRRYGVARVDYDLPNRFGSGYGLHAAQIEEAHRSGVGLIVTVDNGINAREAASAAHACGVDLIVTDHHAIEGELPEAAAIVNPKREGPDHPSVNASGAAVAFKLGCALTGEIKDLDLVALGTVADIVPLRGENRDLAAAGLEAMARGNRVGLAALARAAGIDLGRVRAENIAFQLGPRLNAAGRMGDARRGLELLLSESLEGASRLAGELNRANVERRGVENAIFEEADAEIQDDFDAEQRTIVIARRGWHPGVLGIVASRLQNEYHRAVVLVTLDEDGVGRGSARSVPELDVFEALGACREHLVRFGGHRAAAGLTIKEVDVPAFRDAFEVEARRRLPKEALEPAIDVDTVVSLNEIDSRLLNAIERLEPFGHGNPAPVFCSYNVEVLPDSVRELRGQHVRFSVRESGDTLTAIGFNMAGRMPPGASRIDLAYTPKFNTWKGQTSIQLVLKDLRRPPG